MQFKKFRDAVNKKFTELSNRKLYIVNADKQVLWNTYQNTFTEKQNPIFRERRVHECNTCYSFIKNIGAVVAINPDNSLDTIWNIANCPEEYRLVAQAMHNLVSKAGISGGFLTNEYLVGKEYNIEENEAGDIRWEHFYADISKLRTTNLKANRAEINTSVTLFKRALEEFSVESLETVIDLCDSIYRGEEFKPTVIKFLEAKRLYVEQKHVNFVWANYNKYPTRIRNSSIGDLIINIEKNTPLEEAVSKYEVLVAPQNYKRSTAIITKKMKKQALQTIEELGIESALYRRHATIEDISINNVLFADCSVTDIMQGNLSSILDSVKSPVKVPASATEITIEQFLTSVLPNSQRIEALVENRHTGNFVSLVAPVNNADSETSRIFKWSNNFSWSYNGEVTDSIKQRVKSAGGAIDGDLRFSIQWNAQKDNNSDLDAWCKEPSGNLISFSKKLNPVSKGNLDIDITQPGDKVAVENITWPTKRLMKVGLYKFWVNNYSANSKNKSGFKAQIEFAGQIFDFEYSRSLKHKENVQVAEVYFDGENFQLINSLKSTQSSKMAWDISTLQYQPVSTILLSPNFWDGQTIGNKHYFFMLNKCKNPSEVRGFYNEFLSNELLPHRKVFELLSESMKCTPSDNQLSGLGFSSTQQNSLHIKVDNRQYKIIF